MAQPIGHGGRDYPDFGMSTPGASISVVADLGELAARMGASSFYDRQGNVVFWDKFEYGQGNWQFFKDASQDWPFIATYNTLHSPYVCAIPHDGKTETATQVSMGLPYPVSGIFGYELRILFRTSFNWCSFSFNLYTPDDTKYGVIKLDDVNQKMLVRLSATNYIPFADLPTFNVNFPQWNVLKLVIDFDTNKYVRLIYNDVSYDLSSYGLWLLGVGADPRLGISANFAGNAGGTRILLFSNVIVTVNEPI